MDTITVRASALRNFGDSRDSTFCLVTAVGLARRFSIDAGPKYREGLVMEYDGQAAFGRLLAERVPPNAHVVVILPNVYFRSPAPEELGPSRKLAVMACSSTPTSLESIAHFVRMAERTDVDRQESMAADFFARGQATPHLRFLDLRDGTSAAFQHLEDRLFWHEQIGVLGWGQQQLFPAGEISVLPVNVFGQNIDTRFQIDGRLALRGHPVLHSGTPSFLPEDQERIFQRLLTLRDHAVIATVRQGAIVDLEPTDPACRPAADVLRAMCEVDSRYRSLLEIGFGINTELELFPGNSAMNEVHGARTGAVHFGLGIIPYTQYHLDLIAPGTSVVDAEGAWLFGHRPPSGPSGGPGWNA